MTGCIVLVALFFQDALVLDCTQILRVVEVVLSSKRSRSSTRFYTVYTVKTSVLKSLRNLIDTKQSPHAFRQ